MGWLLANIESGASLATAGLCLFLIFAGFSLWKSFSPLGISRLDLAALRAEAQAIDIQIQLAGLEYQGSTLPVVIPSAPKPVAEIKDNKTKSIGAPAIFTENKDIAPPEEENASTTPFSLDEALLELSE